MDTTMNPSRDSAVRTAGLSWPLLVAIAALVGILAVMPAGRAVGDADSYWHVAAGEWILQHGTTPSGDPFSHSKAGAPWTTQEWLSELVWVGVYRLGGWPAMVLLTAAVFAGVLAGLTRFLLRRFEPVHALLFVGLAAGMLMSHLLARPHVLAWPLLALWVATLVDASERQAPPPLWLLPVMLLWANLHGSFTLGLALAGALALDALIAAPREARRALALRWGGFVAAALVLSILTPNGVKGLVYTFEVMHQSFALATIDEWQPPNFQKLQPLEVWLVTVMALALAGRVSLPLMRLVIVIGLVHLALKHNRNVAILGMVSAFLMATPLAQAWRAKASLGSDADTLDRWFRALAGPARGVTVAVSLSAVLVLLVPLLVARDPKPSPEISPRAALAAARQAGVQGNVLNEYSFGGFLISERVPVFLDGRSDMYGDDLLRRNAEALTLHDPTALTGLLADYKIGWTLLMPGTPALVVLDALPGWKRVYGDGYAVVHMRVGAGD